MTNLPLERSDGDLPRPAGAPVADAARAVPVAGLAPVGPDDRSWRRRVPSTGPLRALRYPAFTTVWGTFALAQTGFWISNVSLQYRTADLSDDSALALGLLYFFNLIPMLLLSPVAGVMADRMERRIIVSNAQAGIAGTAVVLSVGVWGFDIDVPVMYVFAFTLGSLNAINSPAAQAVVANVVEPKDLSSAVSLQSVAINLTRIAGPALAAPILVLFGAGPAFAVFAATSATAAIAFRRLKLPPIIPEDDDGSSVFARIRQGLQHARSRPPAMLALSLVAVNAVFAQAYVALLAVFAIDVFDGGDAGFTLLVIGTGVGAVTGALLSGGGYKPLRIERTAAQMVVMALLLIAFSQARGFPMGLVLGALVGGVNFMNMTQLQTIVQQLVDDHHRGRVMALFMVCWGGLVPIGSLMLGVLGSVVGPRLAVTMSASVVAIYATSVVVRLRIRPVPPIPIMPI